MLSTADIQGVIARTTYKPGWTFVVYEGMWEGPHLSIRVQLPDNFQPGQMIDLGFECFLPPMPNEEYLLLWLAKRLERIEVHEMREALKLDGKVIFDPHAPYADRDLR